MRAKIQAANLPRIQICIAVFAKMILFSNISQNTYWVVIGMSEKTIAGGGKAFLVLLLPISFLIVFLVSTWRLWLGLILLITGFNLWQRYQWQQWCQGVNPVFHQLIQQNQGSISPMDLAIKGNFSGSVAKRYLNTKAEEFGANVLDTEDGNQVYYFMTATILGDILDSSEPIRVLSSRDSNKAGTPLLAAPIAMPVVEQKEPELVASKDNTQLENTQLKISELETTPTEVAPSQETHEEATKTLTKQLAFGSMIQSELAKRLGVYSSTVFKRRDDSEFPEWSRNRDPDGIAWRYDRKSREFFPIEE